MDTEHDTEIVTCMDVQITQLFKKNELIERNGFDQRCRCYKANWTNKKKKSKREEHTSEH